MIQAVLCFNDIFVASLSYKSTRKCKTVRGMKPGMQNKNQNMSKNLLWFRFFLLLCLVCITASATGEAGSGNQRRFKA
ncbi:hypothetical protein PT2222_180017 [Paraburkholderia tropica]